MEYRRSQRRTDSDDTQPALRIGAWVWDLLLCLAVPPLGIFRVLRNDEYPLWLRAVLIGAGCLIMFLWFRAIIPEKTPALYEITRTTPSAIEEWATAAGE